MPPTGRPHCVPPLRAEPGHENVEAFLAKGGKLYVVTNGTLCGIFTSESRARKQIEGYPNGRWRKAKTWAVAIELWEEGCTVYHADRCPSHLDMNVVVSSPTPTSVEDAHAHNSRVFFHAGNSDIAYRSQKINASESKFCGRARVLYAGVSGCIHFKRTRTSFDAEEQEKPPTAMPSPLAMMDAVEAFSRMGVEDPFADALPPKQWVLASVNKFFATRLDAISHILDQHMGHADLMGSRNVKKLRAFARGEVYLAKPGEMQYLDDEYRAVELEEQEWGRYHRLEASSKIRDRRTRCRTRATGHRRFPSSFHQLGHSPRFHQPGWVDGGILASARSKAVY
ncbi:hypothetical protein B0H13DRAFT_1913886 [Mycena leptocephala]|nr:hypothetical protein B0H13DRAFT_1913886 [Mycena leptocephala]